ncbi:MAG TPA: alpha amylase C-terminal domain-containing protein [Methylomirabilota bacterium]|nr:alpha amylase C-terminal domain-containing protein [Methylomirabilota bacterium]
MTLSQQHIDAHTPMGATLVTGGATFRVWAPGALAVHLRLAAGPAWTPDDANALMRDASGYWAGFVPGVRDGDAYRFHVVGAGSTGPKRDPYARELGPGFPDCDCIVRDPRRYPWHDAAFRPPALDDLIVYQFHVGTFYAVDGGGRDRRRPGGAKFLDVLDRVEHLAALGVTAIQPLPVDEFATAHSLGYNGTDYFSPDEEYAVPAADLDRYVATANRLLGQRGQPPLRREDLLSQADQLRAMVDVCHVWGLAVVFDVVYNHAGGDFGDQSLYFFDRAVNRSNNDSLYFTGQGWAGGLVFAYWKREVRQFLIDNARFYVDEYHVDGFRYDEVTVIDRFGGWSFCQDLTSTLRFLEPGLPQIAEYWQPDQSWVVRPVGEGGAGFDSVWADGLRDAVRAALAAAARGRDAVVDLDAVAGALRARPGFAAAWQSVTHLENHDIVYAGHADRQPRIAALGDPGNARSWYARSRARVATGLLLTAPGVPMLFMGQEILEDKPWSDTPSAATLIWWDGLAGDRAMRDHLRFTQDAVRLRRAQPALRGEPINVFHVHDANRVLAFHRWLEGAGRDVVVVASLNESTLFGYGLGFPGGGRWLEVFNSDVYDNFVNPQVAGNGGAVVADGPPLHGLPASAAIVIPANGVLVFARDPGD